MDSPTSTPKSKEDVPVVDLQSIRGKHAALRKAIQNDETEAFRQSLMKRVESDERSKHYSLYHNFDMSLL